LPDWQAGRVLNQKQNMKERGAKASLFFGGYGCQTRANATKSIQISSLKVRVSMDEITLSRISKNQKQSKIWALYLY
jgi:hypothetical protein